MANESLIRNPQTGRYLSRLQSMSAGANLALQQHGMTKDEQALLAMEAEEGRDSRAVQNIILELTRLVREHSGSVADLRKALSLVLDIAGTVKSDVTLSAPERKRVDGFIKDLISFIQRKTSLTTRITTSLKNVAKAGPTTLGHAREGLSEKLSESPSFLFRMVGKALAVKDDENQKKFEKELLKTKASILRKVSGATGTSGMHSPYDEEDEDEDYGPTRAGHGPGIGGEDLGELLTVDKAILEQITIMTQILRTGGEATFQEREARERAGAEGRPAGPTTSAVIKEKKAESAGLLGLLGPVLGTLGAGLLGLMKSAAGTVASVLEGIAAKILGTGVASLFGRATTGIMGVLASGLAGAALGSLTPEDARVPDENTEANDAAALAARSATASVLAAAGVKGIAGLGLSSLATLPFTASGDTANLFTPEERRAAKEKTAATQEAIDKSTGMPGLPPATSRILGESDEKFAARSAKDLASFQARKTRATEGRDIELPSPVKAPAPVPVTPSPVKAAALMHVSEPGLKKLQGREGFVDVPYWDVDHWAIGYGDSEYNGQQLGHDPKQFGGFNPQDRIKKALKPTIRMSQAEADAALRKRIGRFESIVRKPGQTQGEFDALVSVAYNSEAAGKKLSNRLAAGETLTEKDFAASATVHGQPSAGLQVRRGGEFAQFVGGSGDRSAAPVEAMTAAVGAGRQGPPSVTVVAPNMTAAGGGGAQAQQVVAQRIDVDNPDQAVRALRSVNSM